MALVKPFWYNKHWYCISIVSWGALGLWSAGVLYRECLQWIMIKNKHKKHNEWMSPSWVERNGARRGKATYGSFQISFQARTKDEAAPGGFTFLDVCRALCSEGLGFTRRHRRMTRTMDQRKHAGKDDNRTLLFSLQISLEEQLQILWGQINRADRFLCSNLFINL